MNFKSSFLQLRGQVNPSVLEVKPYVPGKPIEEVAKEFKLKKKEVLKMASNENPLGSSKKALQAIRKALPLLHYYPDGNGKALKEKLAKRLVISSNQIILGNGSNEILEFLAKAFLKKGDTAITGAPTFSLYKTFCQLAGAGIEEIPLKNYAFDLDSISSCIHPRTKMVFVCNPNNPTGTALTHKKLKSFISTVKTSALIVLDEAYGDFREDENFNKSLEFLTRPNVILLRTFSKLFGLAGLRIGYAIAHETLIQLLERVRQPFNTNHLAQVAALAALGDSSHEKKSLLLVQKEKVYFSSALQKMGFFVIPTQANFICFHVGKGKEICEKMLRHGVIARPLDSFEMPEFIRVTLGTREQNNRFLKVFKTVLN